MFTLYVHVHLSYPYRYKNTIWMIWSVLSLHISYWGNWLRMCSMLSSCCWHKWNIEGPMKTRFVRLSQFKIRFWTISQTKVESFGHSLVFHMICYMLSFGWFWKFSLGGRPLWLWLFERGYTHNEECLISQWFGYSFGSLWHARDIGNNMMECGGILGSFSSFPKLGEERH